MTDRPEIQLIANLVVENPEGAILLVRYDPEAETRWWLPGHELEPYQHPDEAAQRAVDEIGGVTVDRIRLARVQSFRGRRGWHISFDYHIHADGRPDNGDFPAAWHDPGQLPPTMHGKWERDTIVAVRAGAA